MTQDRKRELTPKLRFPDFRDEPAWTAEPLREFATVITEKAGERKCVYLSITSGVGLISQEQKFGRTIAGESYKNYFLIKKNDFAYNKSATRDFPQGFIARYSGDEPGSVPNSIFTCFRVQEDRINVHYLDHLFVGNLHGRWLVKYITIGARAHGSLSINDKDLMSLPIPCPGGASSLDEQEKIADCLVSLDQLIAACGRKLDALNAHKKGLMQQLFPRAGETIPRLRFPEFRDAPGWKVKNLWSIAENLDNKRVPITEGSREKGSVPYYGASGIVDYVKESLFDEDLLCISEDGANLVARTYPIAFSISGKSWVNNHVHVLRFAESATQTVVEEYLNSIDLSDFITGMAQPKLNKAMLDSIPIPLSSIAEHERIASCVNSLDELINAQSRKLDSLKAHKKGLTQQLFPSPDEAEA